MYNKWLHHCTRHTHFIVEASQNISIDPLYGISAPCKIPVELIDKILFMWILLQAIMHTKIKFVKLFVHVLNHHSNSVILSHAINYYWPTYNHAIMHTIKLI